MSASAITTWIWDVKNNFAAYFIFNSDIEYILFSVAVKYLSGEDFSSF